MGVVGREEGGAGCLVPRRNDSLAGDGLGRGCQCYPQHLSVGSSCGWYMYVKNEVNIKKNKSRIRIL